LYIEDGEDIINIVTTKPLLDAKLWEKSEIVMVVSLLDYEFGVVGFSIVVSVLALHSASLHDEGPSLKYRYRQHLFRVVFEKVYSN
jgi:hypothetical protein